VPPTSSPLLGPPASEDQLRERASALAGCTLGEVGARLGLAVPSSLLRAKGWVGQLLERALGASAASRDCPDFPELGIELKTLPVDRQGRPVESTFVCTIPLAELREVPWEQSRVRRKLDRVLWIPVEGERAIPIAARRIGAGLLWSPAPEQEAALRFDWEELAGTIGRGGIESLTGHVGRHLQVRPKAAHSRVRRRAIDAEGELSQTMPRGFYLRATFTAELLRQHYALPAARRTPG
jgi:DNA mismatch repair protein MutH